MSLFPPSLADESLRLIESIAEYRCAIRGELFHDRLMRGEWNDIVFNSVGLMLAVGASFADGNETLVCPQLVRRNRLGLNCCFMMMIQAHSLIDGRDPIDSGGVNEYQSFCITNFAIAFSL